MPSFISPTEDTSFREAMANLHETWAKPIVIFQTRKKVVISTNPNHNFLYSSGPGQTQTQDEVVKTNSTARIHYKKDQPTPDFKGLTDKDQLNVEVKDWDVKMIVNDDVKTILEKAQRIEFNGKLFKLRDDTKSHGVISYQFTTFYLKALN